MDNKTLLGCYVQSCPLIIPQNVQGHVKWFFLYTFELKHKAELMLWVHTETRSGEKWSTIQNNK